MSPAHLSRREFLRASIRSGLGITAASLLPLPASASGHRTVLRRAQYVMGTIVTIEAHGESRAHCYDALSRAFEELHRLDRIMSLYKRESQLCAVNANAGREAVTVDRSLIEVVLAARMVHTLTGGAFDITIEPLMRVWGFRDRRIQHRPADRDLASAHEAIGFERIRIDEKNGTIGLTHPRAALDLGGIAVGYSVDRVVSILREEGIEVAFVNHSGDVYALGSPDDADGWTVAVPDPATPQKFAATLVLKDNALSTSALYEKYLELDGVRFGHIVDPFSCEPSRAARSVSVIAPSALIADALSTGMFLMSENELPSLVEQFPHVHGICIDHHVIKNF
jgi:thiamine biosynthesis lipoprotein